jgi:hypothetical protein
MLEDFDDAAIGNGVVVVEVNVREPAQRIQVKLYCNDLFSFFLISYCGP